MYYLQNYSYPVAQSKANRTIWRETLSHTPAEPPSIIQDFTSPDKNAMITPVTFFQAYESFGQEPDL
jgi:hypothetical protein